LTGKTEITCPSCNTVFTIDIAKIPEKGVHANCKKCKYRLFISRPADAKTVAVSASEQKLNAAAPAAPVEKTTPAGITPGNKPDPVARTPVKKAKLTSGTPENKPVPAVQPPEKQQNPTHAAKPVKKKNFLLVGGLAGLTLLIFIGAGYFLMQKYNLQITAKNTAAVSQTQNTPDITESSVVAQAPVTPAAENVSNMDLSIGDLFNKVNPAVATVLTYDSGNNIFRQGSGFFINRDGNFITNYHVLEGAYYVVIKLHNKTEYKVQFVLAASEKKDLIKLAVNVPGGALKPGMWLDINPNQPEIADKIIVIGTPMGLGRTVSDGIISAIREIPDRGIAYQMTAPISRGSSGSPVIDMDGQVVGVAFLQLVKGQNLNFAIPSEEIIAMEDKEPLTIAAWTEKVSRDKNDNLANLQKEIIKHIKHERADEKEGREISPQPTNEVLKAKLVAEIINESGIAKQINSLTEAVLASFEEQYENADDKKVARNDEKFTRFEDVIRLATNSERFIEYLEKHLASDLTIAELEQILKWYKSPQGERIAEIEFSSYAVKREHANKLRAAFRLTQYQSASRADLFSRLDDATGATEAMVELQTSLIVQNQILAKVLSKSEELDQVSIDEIIRTFENDIDPYLDMFSAQLVFAGFVYAYRGLPKADLEAYLSFAESEAGRHFYSIIMKKSNTVLLDCNKRILTSIIRVMNEDSWVNIQKDLNAPIEEG